MRFYRKEHMERICMVVEEIYRGGTEKKRLGK
jgi:hypothetical protein